ncbi:MAG TPA: hypothetical protein VGI10_25655 [Polyangiaceae bacterium]|jgi:hypothetical protein
MCLPTLSLAVLALSLGALSTACAPPRASADPERVLDRYSQAVGRGDLSEAYALLSTDAKKTIPFEQFKRMIQENPEQARETAEALRRPQAGPPRVTATVTATDGHTLLLVFEGGAWRVDGSAIDLYGQTTPEATAAAFVRAVENKRYDILLRFVPDSQREGLTEATLRSAWEGEQKQEMTSLCEALKSALPNAHFEVVGERATLSFGAAGMLELVREQGVWKVEELK